MAPATLSGWLEYIERQHPHSIALGLDRVARVYGRLDAKPVCPVITVGGTNGKGSTTAMLESILSAAGYRTGLYTSPHLLRYNERVRIAGCDAEDGLLCEAFAAVEAARAGTPLTYFEFGTLAALWLFARSNLDALILEVGLGGRLDAVNIVDADCAVITSVDIDHTEYLGVSREAIGREKAGIFRAGRPAVIADPRPPQSVLEFAETCGAHVLALGREFSYEAGGRQWSFQGPSGARHGLAYPNLRGSIQVRNASAALCALETLSGRLPIAAQDVRRGLSVVALPARFQTLPGRPRVILDVAHNAEAARVLAENMIASGGPGRTLAVFGMLRDKDVASVIATMRPLVSSWYLAALDGVRAMNTQALAEVLTTVGIDVPVSQHASASEALLRAQADAGDDDRIVVFGSFLTVSDVMRSCRTRRPEGYTRG